ncbi:MAG: hypothetical protein JXA73_22170 [Acidobacteria bacterium]|nr:hypothetical protein [Acidobacteriota bacterium]
MNMRIKAICLVIFLSLSTAGIVPVQAGGPLYVTGPDSSHPGQPYRWSLNPIPYYTDLGSLGNQSNAQANDLISEAFQAWEGVNTANIRFQNAGQLSYDVTANNIFSFQNTLRNCGNTSQPANAIVYDVDGGVIEALGMDKNSTLGISEAICSNDDAGFYARGWVVMNGRFIDGTPDSYSHASVSIEEFKGVFVHEIGHLIGLDHAQINLNCLTESSCPAEDLAGVPLMFPILLEGAGSVPITDDIAAVSALYPALNFSSTTGRIQGRVVFSDGSTPAQGYNVIARPIGDPRKKAVSCVSGFLFTASAGNDLAPAWYDEEIFFGSQDPALIGFYDIPGLPPGDYTIEVEAIYNTGEMAFIEGSAVGPIGYYFGFQYKMPGTCSLQYLNYPSSPSDSCSAKSVVTVGAGVTVNTNTDVILLGTPPRYDAWEDGP